MADNSDRWRRPGERIDPGPRERGSFSAELDDQHGRSCGRGISQRLIAMVPTNGLRAFCRRNTGVIARLMLILLALPGVAFAQKGAGDVVYEPTPQAAVEEMLRMANVSKDDFVIDLGSGDGRIVLTAAKEFGARGLGVDLDHYLIQQSNEAAKREGIADRVKFVEEDLFKTDLSKATVLTLYLLPWMNQKLRPKILELKPGTRVVAHDYDLNEWKPDEKKKIPVPGKKLGYPGQSRLCLWIVPASIDGEWIQSNNQPGTPAWDFEFKQRFQVFDGAVKLSEHTFRMVETNLQAARLSFAFGKDASNHFDGTVEGDRISGTLKTGSGNDVTTAPLILTLKKEEQSVTPASPHS